MFSCARMISGDKDIPSSPSLSKEVGKEWRRKLEEEL